MTKKILLIFIFLLAFILRFWDLGSNPPSLDWDEASLGYNAYSILKTGKDEYGNFLPLSIRSFGDYKPPLYTYLTTIPVAIFGLNEFSTRFISALFGTFTVIVGYFLVKQLFPNKSPTFYLLSFIFFSLSPWHIQFSRIAFEANLALFWFILAIYLFILSRKYQQIIVLSFISFALSMYSYHSPRVLAPLIIFILLFLYRGDIIRNIKNLILSLIIFLLLIFPVIKELSGTTSSRLSSVTIINAQERLGESIKDLEYDKDYGDILGGLVHNRRIIFGREILGGYLDHFNFDFLFLTGDGPARHHAAGVGMLYIWDTPFILIGMIYLLKNRSTSSHLVFLWFLIAPIASSLTTGTPHAVRALFYLPTYQIFIAFGLIETVKWLKSHYYASAHFCVFIIVTLFILNFFYYSHMYWVHTPVEYAKEWQYGYKEAIEEISKIENKYSKIIVTYRYDQPYVYFLFYNKIDPIWYQQNWGRGEIKRMTRSFGKYEFTIFDYDQVKNLKNVLVVGTPGEIPENTPGLLKEINFPDGSVAFRIVVQ